MVNFVQRFIFSFFILILSISAHGQSVSGKVTDSEANPISDAYIYSSNRDRHAHSDQLGRFTCGGLAIGDTLFVRFLGFKESAIQLKEEDFEKPLLIALEDDILQLNQVYVSNSLKDISQVSGIDLATDPVNSSQELLRKVPGLFIGQHAGGGKAEQIFLRGFDIDHGTDLDLQVDGMPVNMVSHAHGQGYADLHFLIPETVENIDYGKGPYYIDKGNFNTAGYVDFKTKERLDMSTVGIEVGRFNMSRMLGLFNLLDGSEHQSAYIAAEYLLSDGPFISSQNFNRLNLLGKYNLQLNEGDRLSLTLSHFQSKWDASGQIPQRLVDNNTIDRFGSVDDTEGGETSRTNLSVSYTKALNASSFIKTRVYVSSYNFELYSNFTFFLEDPVNGDQIRQKEERTLYGVESSIYQKLASVGSFDVSLHAGGGFRYDDINSNELSHTVNRQETLDRMAYGDIDETNIYGFAGADLTSGRWRFMPGVRVDAFRFGYLDKLTPTYTNEQVSKARVSPKLNITYNPNMNWQLFIKSGIGFHSNDTRVVTSGEEDILPAAYGIDVGSIWKPNRRLWLQGTLWYLLSEQEFVYVGDAGIVEPSGKSRRYGVETSIRYQLSPSLYVDTDITYSHARSLDASEGSNYIPLAPEWTASGGISYLDNKGFAAGAHYRFINDRPANEDGSIIADGYFVVDLNGSYTYKKKVTLSVTIENLFNTEWNEAQFATESRLKDEPEPVEELHFTPGMPFFIKGGLSFHF